MTVIGFRIFVNGQPRSFHDVKETAFGMAENLAAANKGSRVKVFDEASGAEAEVSAAGVVTALVPAIMR